MNEFKKYRITDTVTLGPDVNAYRFEPLEGSIPKYKPGHFAFLHLLDENGETIVKRPYSIASSPEMPYMEFCIKLVGGELTGRLAKLGKGAVVGIGNPGGHMTYNDELKAAFIAGGTGISPMMSMLRHIVAKKLEGEFVFFYSVRRKENILYKEELEELAKNENIRVVITLTREEGEWPGERGRLCPTIIEKNIADAGKFHWWICGPMEMIKGMTECLSGMNADPKKISMEGWG